MDIAVIGAGGTGSATARFLAQAGHAVTVYEQFQLNHEKGSSHGHSRIIRRTYPSAFYTAMMGRAYPLWRDLEAQAQRELLVTTGGLFIGPAWHAEVQACLDALEANSLPVDQLTEEEVQERFPALRLKPGEVAIFQPESGFLRATDCVTANMALATAAGAELHEFVEVTRLDQTSGGVEVSWAGGNRLHERAMVCAGPWAGRLLAALNLPLRVEQRQVVYLETTGPAPMYAPGNLPVWIDLATNFYGFPRDGRMPGVKVASHSLGHRFDPTHPRRPVVQAHIDAVQRYAHERLYGTTTNKVVAASACLYTSTPDEDFIVDFVPDKPDILLVSGCSGHGFKFTVLLGQLAAQLVTGTGIDVDISPWRLQRFKS